MGGVMTRGIVTDDRFVSFRARAGGGRFHGVVVRPVQVNRAVFRGIGGQVPGHRVREDLSLIHI